MKLIIDTEVIKDHIETEWGYEGIWKKMQEKYWWIRKGANE